MKFLLLLFLFSSCNKIIYLNHNIGGYDEQLSLLWKKGGEYRAAIIVYHNHKDHWLDMTANKLFCGSVFFSEYIKTGKKTSTVKTYYVSRTGNEKIHFSQIQLKLFSDMKRIVDSLGWCQSGILSIPDSLYFTEIQRKKKISR